jgi:hypothetical protein
MGGFVSSVGNAISGAVSDVGNLLSNPTVDALGLGALDIATGGLAAPLDATALMSDAALGGSFAGDAFSLGTAAADAGTAASAITPAMLAAAQSSSDPIGMLSYLSSATPAEVSAATSGGAGSALSLADVLNTAKTGSQLIGGLGQLGTVAKLLGGTGVKAQQAAPFAPYQAGLAAQLNNLIQNPSTVTTTPGYQFNLQQYMQALQAQQAAQGKLASGGALVQAGQMGQQYAQSSLANQESLLASLTGATQSPASAAQAAQGVSLGNTAATQLALQGLSSGTSNVVNPLATLYSQYNTQSPSVS